MKHKTDECHVCANRHPEKIVKLKIVENHTTCTIYDIKELKINRRTGFARATVANAATDLDAKEISYFLKCPRCGTFESIEFNQLILTE